MVFAQASADTPTRQSGHGARPTSNQPRRHLIARLCILPSRQSAHCIHTIPTHTQISPKTGDSNSSCQPISRRTTMSIAGKRALTSLKDFTQAPDSSTALEKLLYGEDVNYGGLRYVFLCVHGWARHDGGWGLLCRASMCLCPRLRSPQHKYILNFLFPSLVASTHTLIHAIKPHPTT